MNKYMIIIIITVRIVKRVFKKFGIILELNI